MPVEQMQPAAKMAAHQQRARQQVARQASEKSGLKAVKKEEECCSITSSTTSTSSTSQEEGEVNSAQLAPSNLSTADYDHLRNTTLMFFLDRLYMSSAKKGPGGQQEVRTLHDLSCLFGTRGFTKEMRQIVGASRNGLKRFLQSYPSLFTVDGDQVYLTQLEASGGPSGGSSSGAAGGARDYNREAVDYFAAKLAQFGTSLVPIKNLFGYRSQASQEVRHVSGRTSREFRQFLLSQPQVFEVLAGEHVVLRSALEELESRGETAQSLEQRLQAGPNELVAMDSYLNKQFAQSVCESIRSELSQQQQQQPSSLAPTTDHLEEALPLSQLHERLLRDCHNQLFLQMVRTRDDLRLFLRMHPKLFKRLEHPQTGCELVRLVSEPERAQMERLTGPLTLATCAEPAADTATSYASLPANLNAPQQAQPALQAHPTQQQQQQQQQRKPSLAEDRPTSGLRANAPAFVPSSQQQQHTTQQRPAASLRTALREHLVRAQASNLSNGAYSARKASNGAAPATGALGQRLTGGQVAAAAAAADDLRARTIDIVREASRIISLVMNTTDRVAFDCEGYNLGFNNSQGQITLIQLAFLPASKKQQPASNEHNNNNDGETESQEALLASGRLRPEMCVFDLLTNPELAYCLKPLLESEQIEKVMHDVRNKSNALYQQFGVMLNRVFDTQVANLVIQQQETGKPAYKSHYISMAKLCELYGSEWLLKHRNSIRGRTRHSQQQQHQAGQAGTTSGSANKPRAKDVDYWRHRPLTDAMVYEASMDVYCLMGGVYQNLRARIKPEYMPLFQELNREGVLARIRPDEIRTVKKERKIDLEVIDLKRKLYSDSLRSIVLSNREIRLLRHVDLTPEVRQKIQQCKKVAKKLERLDMKAAQQQQSQDQQQDGSGSEPNSLIGAAGQASLESDANKQDSLGSAHLQDQDVMDLTASLGNLMESSMFDELKDKMIESSSLLESLEDDDDELSLGDHLQSLSQLHHNHQHHHSSSEHSGCNCQCHHSLESQQEPSQPSASAAAKATATTPTETTPTTTSDTSDQPKPPENNKPEEVKQVEEAEAVKVPSLQTGTDPEPQASAPEPKAVDMAVQCDLLS